jgi:DNA polymerase
LFEAGRKVLQAYDADVSERSQKIQARARLALRAEMAFGLDALPIRIKRAESAIPTTTAAQTTAPGRVPTPLAQPAPSPAAAQKSIVDLFGKVPAPAAPKNEPLPGAGLSADEKRRALAELNTQVQACNSCRLCEKRTNTVFGEGDPDAKIMFIGEGPGENEDLQGRPFVGRAGELLNKMIAGMGLKREQVFIVNIVKCRPPGNREPAPDEVSTCTPFLEKQIEIIRPRVIVTLGRPAAQYMLQQKIAISRMRGQWQSWRGIRLMPTFHPAYILRNYTEETRAAVWSDLQQVMAELGMKVPSRSNPQA